MAMSVAQPVTTPSHSQWMARLFMSFNARQGKTHLKNTHREGPLSVQRAFYPEDNGTAHLYLLHPPAGIVSGDELHISANLDSQCQVLLTTPGANRFYRAREADELASRQCQFTHFNLHGDACLEYLPHETLIYPNANAFSHNTINVSDNASYVGWDIACIGLPHIDRPFDGGRFTQTLSLFYNDNVLFHDRLAIQANDAVTRSRIGLAGHHVIGTMIMFDGKHAGSSTWAKALCNKAMAVVGDQDDACEIAVTQLQGVVIIRYLGDDSEACRGHFGKIWSALRPDISGRNAVTPRIWYT